MDIEKSTDKRNLIHDNDFDAVTITYSNKRSTMHRVTSEV
jgi:hypothetical protein